jgi:hypothetical protein
MWYLCFHLCKSWPASNKIYTKCMPLCANVCHCVPMYATACHCVPMYATVCHCMPLYATACHCVPMYATVCHCMPLCATVCHCMPLCANVCHCMPPNSSSLIATLAPFAQPWKALISLAISVRPHISLRLPLDSFPCNLISGTFKKFCPENQNFLKNRTRLSGTYMRT